MGDGAAVCVRWRGWAAQSVEDRALPGVVQPDHHNLVLAAAKDAVVQVREAGAHDHGPPRRRRCELSRGVASAEGQRDGVFRQRRTLSGNSGHALRLVSAAEALKTVGCGASFRLWEASAPHEGARGADHGGSPPDSSRYAAGVAARDVLWRPCALNTDVLLCRQRHRWRTQTGASGRSLGRKTRQKNRQTVRRSPDLLLSVCSSVLAGPTRALVGVMPEHWQPGGALGGAAGHATTRRRASPSQRT